MTLPAFEHDPWLDPLASGLNSELDRGIRAQSFADDFGRKLRDVEAARWQLQGVDFGKLADPRFVIFRALVEQLGRDVAATCADLLAALPEPEPEPERARLVDRLLEQAKGR